MITRRVHNLLARPRAAADLVEGRIEPSEFGRFGWAADPEENRFELWNPPPDRDPDA